MGPVATDPKDIINAYNKHKEDFLIIDLNNIKEYGMKTVKYLDIKIKMADNSVIIPYIKFIKLQSAGKINPPAERNYEKLKIAVRRDDEGNPESIFGKAMELISETFTKKVKKMKADGVINDDEYDENNNKDVIIVPSCKPQTPLQKFAKDKDGVIREFANPILWFGLNNKTYKPDEEKALKRMDFNYKLGDLKFVVKHFDVDIYDNDNIVDRQPQLAMVDNEIISNLTIDKFITMKSQLSGLVYMQVKASKQSFNLNTKVVKSLYVRSNKSNKYSAHLFNQEELDNITGVNDNECKPAPVPVSVPIVEPVTTKVEIDEYDSDESSINDEINNLKFT